METEKVYGMEKKFIMQTYDRQSLVVAKGKGCYVYDMRGKRYLDLVGGLATCPLGHSNGKLANIVKSQILKVINASNLYYSEEQVLLAEKLVKLSGLGTCFFSNSGTESVEAAIKLARKYTGKTDIVAAKNSFHGRTYGSLSATGKEKIKKGFEPLVPGFTHVDYGNAKLIGGAITQKTAAVILEPIQGESGVVVPPKDYLKDVRKICDKHGVLLILDEVQTGVGRTGKFFAYGHEGIKPDIVTLAKGLANGIPIGATLASNKVASGFKPGDHGSTFGGNSLACKAALFTLDFIMKNSLMKNAEKQGSYLMEKLSKLDGIKNVRGKGLIIGMDIKNAKEVVKKCISKGLIINSTSESTIRLLPPLIITKKQIDDSIMILKGVLDD